MAETTGVAELIVRVKDEASKNMKELAKILQTTLDPEQWEEVKKAMEELGVEVDELADDFDKLKKEQDDAGTEADKTRKKLDKMTDTLDDVADSADLVGGRIGGIASEASNLLGVLTRVNPLLAAIGVVLGGAGLGVAAANDVGVYAKELDTLSTVANVTTQELQEFAAGTERVGFDLDKTADILKDINDRFGDFTSTGGGALQDYFDALGDSASYTAQQLQDMSTLDAIQAIQNDLEEQNIPLERQIFLWESLAGESSKLLPILRNNGEAMKQFAQEARDRGEILSDEEIRQAKEFEKAVSDMGKALNALWTRIGIAVLPIMESLVETLNDTSDLIAEINGLLANAEAGWDDWATAIGKVSQALIDLTPSGIQANLLNDAINGVVDADADISDANIKRFKAGYEAAESTLSDVRSKIEQLSDAENILKARIESQEGSRAQQQNLVNQLIEVQRELANLTSQEQLAVEKVLQAKLALKGAQDAYNASVKEGVEAANEGTETGTGEQLGLETQKILDGYRAQLTQFYTDVGATLQDRLGAAAKATELEYKEAYSRLRALGAPTDVLDGLVNQQTARAQFDIISTEFDRVAEDVELRAAKVGRQVANGIISEADAYEELQRIYGDSGEALNGLLSQMERLAESTGSQELAQQVEVMRNSVEEFQQSLGDDGFVKPQWAENMEKARESIRDLKAELDFRDLDLTSIEGAMNIAVDQAIEPLERLRDEIRKTLSGEELENAELDIAEAIDVAAVDAKLDTLETLFQQRVGTFNTLLATVQLQEDAGLITEAEAAERLKVAYTELYPELENIKSQMSALAEETGSPELLRRVQELDNQFLKLSLTVDEATASLITNMTEAGAEAAGSGLAQAITDIATEAESLGDVFDNVMKGILQSMLQVVQSAVAQQFTSLILGAVGGGGGFAGGGVQAFATGGYVRGAGTTKSDSIRAYLSDKEFVQPADATAYYGVQFMEMLRRKAIPREVLAALMGGSRSMPVHAPRTPRFNSGGFVSGDVLGDTTSGARDGDLNVTLVQVKDENEAQAYVTSKRGANDIVKVLEQNKTKVKQIIS